MLDSDIVLSSAGAQKPADRPGDGIAWVENECAIDIRAGVIELTEVATNHKRPARQCDGIVPSELDRPSRQSLEFSGISSFIGHPSLLLAQIDAHRSEAPSG